MVESGSSTAQVIWISDELTTGEKVNVTHQASHDSLDDDGDVCTAPDRHLDLLVLFCRWVSLQELARQQIKAFRLKYVFLAGKIIRSARYIVMKLPAKYSYQDVYEIYLA